MRRTKKTYHRLTSLTAALSCSLLFCSVSPALSATVGTETFKEVDPELLFTQGMESRIEGRLYSSIEAFQQILEEYPELHRARLELAVSYYNTFNFDGALQEAQTVLDEPDIPPNVRIAILAFMAQVKKDQERFTLTGDWQFPVMIGYMHDSNVSAGPDSRAISGYPGFTLDDEDTENSDSAWYFNGGVEHVLQTGKYFRFGEQPASLLWKSKVNIYHRAYFDEHDYNLTVYTFRTGPALLSTGNWRASLDLQEEVIRYGGEDLADYTSLIPQFTWYFENGIELGAECLFTHRSYAQDEDTNRTGDYIAPQISIGYVTKDNKFAFQGHAAFFNEDAKATRKSNDGYNLFLGGSWNFLADTSLLAMVNYRDTEYDGREPLFNKARDEDEWRSTLGIRHTFKDMGAATDWSIGANITYTDHESNVSIYEYDRTQVSLYLQHRF